MADDSLRVSLESALVDVSARIGQDARLGGNDGVAFRIGSPPVDVAVEWIGPGRCIAVHAPFLLPRQVLGEATLPLELLKAHLAGAGTGGCSFWMTPEGLVRVGVTLIGPRTDVDQVLEAIGRVEHMARRIFARMTVDGGGRP